MLYFYESMSTSKIESPPTKHPHNLRAILKNFGLTPNEREVYLLLARSSWSTVLSLSQKTNIKRTTLYRIIDLLQKKGLVEMRVDDKTSYYKAGDPKNFESLIVDQEKKTKIMRNQLNMLQGHISLLTKKNPDQISVNFHRGTRGIQALEWKMAEEKNAQIFVFGNDSWRKLLGPDFSETIRAEHVAKNLLIKEILNPQNDKPIPKSGLVEWTKNTDYIFHHYQHRTIETQLLPIQNEFYVFEEKIVLFSLEKDEIAGIEISNKNYAQLLRQMFKIMWNQAKIIDAFGGENFKI